MTLTATATTQTKTKIFNLLDMEMPFEVVTSPNRNNICYVVQKMENGCSLVDNFQCILSELKIKGKHSMRTIILVREAEVILPTFSRDKSILLLNCPLHA